MPSAPEQPRERPHAMRPVSRREHESFDWYDAASTTLAASTEFQEVARFSGTPESIVVQTSAAGIDVRLRNRGSAAGASIRLGVTGFQILAVAAQIVEARDPTGAGGQTVTAIGRHASSRIERREVKHGPDFAPGSLPEEALNYQVEHHSDPLAHRQ